MPQTMCRPPRAETSLKRRKSNKRYNNSEKGRARSRRYDATRRERMKNLGLCSICRVREPEPLMATCVRCQRYKAEHGWLGYSAIPLARGSVG